MSTSECGRWRPLLAVNALGHLGKGESTGLQAHLDGCSDCRAEARDLEGIERALRMVDSNRLESMDEPDQTLEHRILEQVRQEREQRRRRFRWAVAGSAAVATIAAAIVLFIAPSDTTTLRRVHFRDTPSGVTASATFQPRAWGTEIQLIVKGLATDRVYSVWLETADGRRVSSGSFRSLPEREVRLVLSAALPLEDATTIGLNSEGNTVMTAPLSDPEK